MTKDNIVTYIEKALQLSRRMDICPDDNRPSRWVKDYDMLEQHLGMLTMLLRMEAENDPK